MDLATQAETGVNVDWYLRDAVARSVDDLGHQFNARELLSAYTQGLQAQADEVERARMVYAGVLQTAAAIAARKLKELD